MRESDEHSCIVFFDDDHHQLGLAPVLLLIELYLNDIALLARKFGIQTLDLPSNMQICCLKNSWCCNLVGVHYTNYLQWSWPLNNLYE
jgi:hypothetical protein